MSEQDSKPLTPIQHPMTYERTEWIPYWQAIGQTWRTEPEIETERSSALNKKKNSSKGHAELYSFNHPVCFI